MKILHLSSETSWRGGEQQIAYLIEELQRLGINCVVVCRPNSAFENYCRRKGLAYHALPLKNSLDLVSAWKLRRICRAEKIDLVHVHSSRGHAIMHLAQLLGTSTPFLLTRRVAFPIKNKGLNVLRYNSPQLRKIVCISRAVLESTAPVVKQKEKLAVVYDGIDLSRFAQHQPISSLHQELQLNPKVPLVGTVAALTDEKDLPTFIRAAKEISTALPQLHFVIVGDGPQLPVLQEQARNLQLEDRLHFMGRRNDVPLLLPQLSLFMFTSRMEGLGTSVLDAFACELPVVATAAGGIPEIVRNEETGLLAPVGDAASLATAAIRILSNPSLATQLTKKAQSLLLQTFTKENMAAETLKVYQEVLTPMGQGR